MTYIGVMRFEEMKSYADARTQHLSLDMRHCLYSTLSKNPEAGLLMPNSDGIRQLRLPCKKKYVLVDYKWYPDESLILLLDVYAEQIKPAQRTLQELPA